MARPARQRRLLIDTRKSGLTIPAPAVQPGQDGAYVYVVSPDGQAHVRAVTVAQQAEEQSAIQSAVP